MLEFSEEANQMTSSKFSKQHPIFTELYQINNLALPDIKPGSTQKKNLEEFALWSQFFFLISKIPHCDLYLLVGL